jgi:hypothetical protein
MKTGDILAIIILSALIVATCFLSHERGIEASSLHNKIASLEAQIENMKPMPRINVARASIYPLSGEVVVETAE